jgi:phytoene dehydrogenase-like protein
VVIGGGLSGLAAAIRLARFNDNVLLLEKHSRLGGLNSYYYRDSRLLETGLHAITNYAAPGIRQAPFNRLLRQLKLSRQDIGSHEQVGSEIRFPGCRLRFSNDFSELLESVENTFGSAVDDFSRFVSVLDGVDPFLPTPFQSTRSIMAEHLREPLLREMLLCPMCYYGSSIEDDVDFNQFVILFRAIFQEGLFRPRGSIKQLLDLLVDHFHRFGGKIKSKSGVSAIHTSGDRVVELELDDGQNLTCDQVISTIGHAETLQLLGAIEKPTETRRLGFLESIFVVDEHGAALLPDDITCLFYNDSDRFRFRRPADPVDFSSGVVSLPKNFRHLDNTTQEGEIRSTHLANYERWRACADQQDAYRALKKWSAATSQQRVAKMVGDFAEHIVFQDSFTPVTIERFTGKKEGAIYGSPIKATDGRIGYANLFLAGTDQGYLGIVGSMLSGVTVVNRHLLMKS